MELEFQDGIGTLVMRNGGAFNAESLAAFNTALDAAAQEEAQVLLITGEGKHFSPGLDLEFLMAVAEPGAAMQFVKDCMMALARLLTFPLPVVAAVNGHAFGLGAMITLAADYKVMREDRGYFCLPEIDLGMTLTQRMNALVCGKLSGNVLREVLLTGRRVTGPDALAWGIVDAVCTQDALRDTAVALAAPMRGKSRDALAGLKRGVNLEILKVLEAEDAEVTLAG